MNHHTDKYAQIPRTSCQSILSAVTQHPSNHGIAWPEFARTLSDYSRLPNDRARPSTELSSWSIGEITFTQMLLPDTTSRRELHDKNSSLAHLRVLLSRDFLTDEAELAIWDTSTNAGGHCNLVLPHTNNVSGHEVLTLSIPRHLFNADALETGCDSSLPVDPTVASLLATYLDGLARHISRISDDHARRLETVTSSLVAACIAFKGDCNGPSLHSIASILVDRARQVVRANMASPEFDTEHLCRLLAVSRSKLYRVLECHGGVARFINHERLLEAHRRLSNPDKVESIHLIAQDVGFEDHSTFSRAFRREFGYTPREARARAMTKVSNVDYRFSLSAAADRA